LAKIIVALLLVIALLPNPYVYYQFLRWVVCLVSAYFAYVYFGKEQNKWGWSFIAIAVIFNPIVPFYLSRGSWGFIDIGAAILMLWSIMI